MKRHSWRSILALLLISAQLITLSPAAMAQAPAQESREEKKLREQQEKEQREREKRKAEDDKKLANAQKKYNTLLDFAQDQYDTSTEFREDVDREYLDLQGQHALQAYKINTQRNTELVNLETDDTTLKIRRVLYDNPWVQDYVNRVGQGLVPADSDKLYAFKVTYHPIPYAYTLSTGTVLISTGMISMLDSEAQLAYVLAHELAHVYKNHWKTKVMMPLAEEEYNKRQLKKAARWAGILGIAGAAVGGAATRSGEGAAWGAIAGLTAGFIISSILNRQIGIDWEKSQENEADDIAMRLVLERSYDTQEVPKIYVAMEEVARFDERVQLGFLGLRPRIRERKEQVDKLLQGAPMQAKYQELLKAGKLIGTSPDYNLVMAALKRDNGIEAYRFDMFQMAKRNLQQAVSLRSDDLRATYYYGRVLKQVGRTPAELEQAQQYLVKAVEQDRARQNMPEVQLQRALLLMEQKDPASADALKAYIMEFQKKRMEEANYSGTLPPNMDTLYDLMRIFGNDLNWKPPQPAASIQAAMPANSNDRPATTVPVKAEAPQANKPQAEPAGNRPRTTPRRP